MKTRYEIKNPENLQKAYVKCAYTEIFKYIVDHPEKRPRDAIEDFLYLVDCAACNSKNGETSFMFSVFYDTGMYVLDSLIFPNHPENIVRRHQEMMLEAEAGQSFFNKRR